jgi:hypothetical protein
MKRPIIVRILFFFLFTTKIIASYDAPMTSIGNSAAMIGIGNIEGFDHSAAVLFQNPASLSGVYNTSIHLSKTMSHSYPHPSQPDSP